MIDTHCHLDLPVFAADRNAVLTRSRQAGIRQWVVPGIRLQAFPTMATLTEPDIHLAWGLHPLFSHPPDALTQLAHWLDHHPPLAMGEIGLDFLAPPETHSEQHTLLHGQLALARERKLPLLLHVRRAHDPMLALLKGFPHGGIVHAFSGSLEQGKRYLELGFRLGFGGVVTRPQATRLRQIAAALPDHALVLESDAPDLPPDGLQGQRNEPCHISRVVTTLSHLRQQPERHILELCTTNAQAVLGLKEPVQ